MKTGYPKLNELLEFLEQPLFVESEGVIEVSTRTLRALSELPAWKWAKLHYQVKRWYDRCYEQLHKTGELFTYPVQRDEALDHKAFFENAVRTNPLLGRIATLLIAEPNLTGDKLYEILKLEGFRPKLTACRVAVRSMQVMLGSLAAQSFVDLKAMYAPVEESQDAEA